MRQAVAHPPSTHPAMAPLPPPEPSRHIETTASLDARKLRFEATTTRTWRCC
jgi:hypothetical protein